MITLRKQRENLGMSLSQLSRLSKVAKTTISDMETGRHAPSFDNLVRVVNTLQEETEDKEFNSTFN